MSRHDIGDLDLLKEQLDHTVYGMSREEAWRQGVCISCRRHWTKGTYSTSGVNEYKISALCEQCFDKIVDDYEEK